MLQVKQLHVVQDKWTFDWNFTVSAGQFLAIVGPSGVGKSTLLHTLLGFNEVQSGSIEWHGEDLTSMPVAQRPFGVLFQDNNLFDHLTVATNLALGLSPQGKLSPDLQQQVVAAAERFQIADLMSKQAEHLSGGQRQRVALARVFLQNKPILLLDEPFSSLDPELREDGLKWVTELQREHGTTILMVTHHLSEVHTEVDSVLEGISCREWTQYAADIHSQTEETL